MWGKSPDRKLDFHQLKHLLVAAVKLDLRSSTAHFGGVASRRFPPFVQLVVFQFFISIGLGITMYLMPARLAATIFVVTTAMVFTALNVMIEFGSLIISPDDSDIISPLPVSSRTYFYAKLVNLLFYTASLTAAIGVVPTAALVIRSGNPLYALTFPSALLTANVAASLVISTVYASLLRHISRERIASALGYVQMIMAISVWGAHLIIPRVVSADLFAANDVTDWWVFLLPPAWYSSLIGIAGDIESPHWIWSSLLGLVALGLLFMYCMKYLSIGYAASLAQSVASLRNTELQVRYQRRGWIRLLGRFLGPEENAVFRLIWAQFKYDSRFKMSVLAILPLTAIYLFLAVKEGGMPDPFVNGSGRPDMHAYLVFFALGIFPSMIQGGVVNSRSYRAAWIFFATPADLTKLMLSTRKFVKIFFLVPYLIMLGLAFAYVFGSLLHAFMLLIPLYSLTMIQLAVTYMIYPGVPFSRPMRHGQGSVSVVVSLLVPVLTIIVPMLMLQLFVFANPFAYLVTIAVLLVAETLITRLSAGVVARKAAAARCAD